MKVEVGRLRAALAACTGLFKVEGESRIGTRISYSPVASIWILELCLLPLYLGYGDCDAGDSSTYRGIVGYID